LLRHTIISQSRLAVLMTTYPFAQLPDSRTY
jgi:hypothetical protein